ncbi:MAG TPA: endonuclease V [Planctomycetota bacterium]|nr:endonuclease V [Planctomycetota bacterium]
MRIAPLHAWALPAAEAVELQRALAAKVRERPLRRAPRLVAGIDCGYSRREDRLYAAVVLCRLPGRTPHSPVEVETVEERVVTARPRMPYIPGLLSFRELPPVLECLERLEHAPEAVLVDGQGRAHPRRLGIASHLGLILGIPTVGCAKSLLVGVHAVPGRRRGSRRALLHRGETVGCALRTRDGVAPVYVSVGHLADLAGAVRLVLAATAGFRLPEPARRAHHLATMARLKDEGGQ